MIAIPILQNFAVVIGEGSIYVALVPVTVVALIVLSIPFILRAVLQVRSGVGAAGKQWHTGSNQNLFELHVHSSGWR